MGAWAYEALALKKKKEKTRPGHLRLAVYFVILKEVFILKIDMEGICA